MNETQLMMEVSRGEDSRHQFKLNFTNTDALASELIAFANSEGGRLFIGVSDNGEVKGLLKSDISRLNQMLSNAASQNVHPPVNPISENVSVKNGLVMIVTVEKGLNKPYVDTQGRIWVKNGADKRSVTSREEMQRLFQSSGLIYADETPVTSASSNDIDLEKFASYFERRYRGKIEPTSRELSRLLRNLNLSRNETPTLAGILLFGKMPQIFKPAFMVKAVNFPGTVISGSSYIDREEIDGTLVEQYNRSMAFIRRNLHHIPSGSSFNSQSVLEIPEAVFEELLVNALIHRDYFIYAPIRLLLFADRVEIVSPGCLPNHLDTEQIHYGVSNLRNSSLASHAFYLLPYSGIGSGIPRAFAAWQEIRFVNDRKANQFAAIVQRKRGLSDAPPDKFRQQAD
ncbi:MAG: putative DNA binding domain-containing protein [Synergistaceae bacterium]|jgi:predicted HTH transcriptional regulator|nr:putative DNA binding domain-containing protein [Synergistaceae bacterium]